MKTQHEKFWRQIAQDGWQADQQKQLLGFIDWLIQKLISDTPDDIAAEAVRDRIFDIVMRAFEAMQPYRPAIKRLVQQIWQNPSSCKIVLKKLQQHNRWILCALKMETTGWRGQAIETGLQIIWLRSFISWLKDDSPDLAATMATLDKTLHWADVAVHKIMV